MISSDLHIHTKYCDGKDFPEEVVKKAIEKGITTIGFSSHSYTEFDKSYAMSMEDTPKYIEEITSLKEKYKDSLEILVGIEKDYYSELDTKEFDYVIGSVHYVLKNGVYLTVDHSKELFLKQIEEYYNGDVYEFISDYYKNVADLNNKINPDIIGHIDLVAKFNEGNLLFDENDERYLTYAYNSITTLCKKRTFFEVNTGAISRGYKAEPYPNIKLLSKIKECGGIPILSSDSHSKENVGYGFDIALNAVKNAGFEYVAMMKNKKFEIVSI